MNKLTVSSKEYSDKELKIVKEIVKKSLLTQKGINYKNIELLSTKFFPNKVIVKIIRDKSTVTLIELSKKSYDELYHDIDKHFLNGKTDETFKHKKNIMFKSYGSTK